MQRNLFFSALFDAGASLMEVRSINSPQGLIGTISSLLVKQLSQKTVYWQGASLHFNTPVADHFAQITDVSLDTGTELTR